MRVALPVFCPTLGPRVLDLPISGCSAALFAPTLLDEPTKPTAIRMKTERKRMEPPALGKEVGLGSGMRSEFSSRFLAALILGHSPCHEENRIPIFLVPFGQPGHRSLHQQRPRTRRLQRIFRPVLCAFGAGGLSVSKRKRYSGSSRARANFSRVSSDGTVWPFSTRER
jgi:hypothetical protein